MLRIPLEPGKYTLFRLLFNGYTVPWRIITYSHKSEQWSLSLFSCDILHISPVSNVVYRFDIILQGTGETAFFNV